MLINNAVITGSFIVNGVDVTGITGSSAISSSYLALSSSYVITSASYAQSSASLSIRTSNLEATSSTLVSASSSFAAQSASLSTRLTGDETNISTLTTASASFAAQSSSLSTRLTTDETNFTNLSSSFATTSGSLSTRVTNLEVTSSVVSSSFATTSGSISSRVTIIEGQDATTGSNIFTGPQYVNQASNAISFTSTASLYTDGGLRVSKDSFVSGTAYFNNITVYGTSSIEYITSSQVNIGSNVITVNTDTPAIRFGGISVFDSGSTQLTGSLFWDSEKNHWIYSNPSGSAYNSAMLMNGPRNTGSLGTEQGTTACAMMIGQGGDHITSSMIYSYGNATCFYGTSYISASGDTCFAGTVCAPSFVGGTMSGTTIYGSTAVCSAVGKFTTCLDVSGTGKFNNNVLIDVTGNTPLTLNRSTSGTALIEMKCSGIVGNYIGTTGTNNLTIYNASASPMMTLDSGAATFSSTITGTTIYGSTAVCSPVGLFSGCVGIGTINPSQKLHVVGSAIIGCTTANSGIYGCYLYFPFTSENLSNGTNRAYIQFDSVVDSSVNQNDTWRWKMAAVARCGNLGCYNSSLEFLRTTRDGVTDQSVLALNGYTGNVGIGTCTPSAKLHINGSTGASTYKGFAYTYAGSETLTNEVLFQAVVGGYSSNLPIFLFKDERSDQGTTQRIFEIQGGRSGVGTILTTLANGNVGIGCTTPGQSLTVQSAGVATYLKSTATSDSATYGNFQMYRQACKVGNGVGFALGLINSAAVDTEYAYIGTLIESCTSTQECGAIGFYTTTAGNGRCERMRITSGGNVYVGATTGAYPTYGYMLGVRAPSGTQTYMSITAPGQSLDDQGLVIGVDANAASFYMRDAKDMIFFTCNTERMRIKSTGIATFACQVCATSGVKFGNGSSTLNYYDEAISFTPCLYFQGAVTGLSYDTRSAYYTRVGNTVFATMYIQWCKASSATDNIGVYLPVTSMNNSTPAIGNFYSGNPISETRPIQVYVAANSTISILLTQDGQGNLANCFANSTLHYWMVTMQYMV